MLNNLTMLVFENDWCAQCYTERPIIQSVAKKYNNCLEVKVINIEDDSQLAVRYGVLAAPTIVILKNNEIVEKIPRFISQDQLENVIRYYL